MSTKDSFDTNDDPHATRVPEPSADSLLTRPPSSVPETRPDFEPDSDDSIRTRLPAGFRVATGPDTVLDIHSPGAFPGYELLDRLGEGGMGEVWRARQVKLNRIVALKMIRGGHRVGDKDLIRFLAEAEAVAAIRHPHVVQVFDYGEGGGRPFIAMEYLPGGSLSDRLQEVAKLPPREAAGLVRSLSEAVQAAHDREIVHRDLKPSNVLFDASGQAKVTDFGLAKRTGGKNLTATQAVMGTPAYMAPEQARGETKFVGPQADVYSLGVILYEALTGTRPFEDDSQMALLRKVAEDEPERPGKRVPGLPRDIELIALKCLAKDPVDRYQTAASLAADLGRFTAGEPVSVRAAGVVERTARWARRKPTLAATYALAMLATLLGGLGGIAAWQWRAAESARYVAEVARIGEKSARTAAEQARAEAEQQREKFERSEYGRTIQVAHQAWRDNNINATLALLDRTRKDLRGWEWIYLYKLCHSELLSIVGAGQRSASFSPDGSRVLTAGSGTIVQQVLPDGSRGFAAGAEAKIWDVRTGRLIVGMKGPSHEWH